MLQAYKWLCKVVQKAFLEEMQGGIIILKSKKILLVVGLILCISGWQSVKALYQDGIEKHYNELGYKSVSQAIKEAESNYGLKLKLPSKKPPLDFTHEFGRFNKTNENLELEYINEKNHTNYIINIFPSHKERSLRYTQGYKVILDDQTKAYYSLTGTSHRISTLAFKKNNWIYILSAEERLFEDPLTIFLDIANSL